MPLTTALGKLGVLRKGFAAKSHSGPSLEMALFKYTSTRALAHLSKCTLRFSSQKDFNDPFDGVPNTVSLIQSAPYQKLLNAHATAPAGSDPQTEAGAAIAREVIANIAKPLYVQRLITDLQKNFRILCLSKAPPDSSGAALMWGHYAQDVDDNNKPHAGLALEFNDAHPWFASHRNRPDRLIGDVEYRPTRACLSTDLRRTLLIKSALWEYEKEVRLVRSIGTDNNELTGPDLNIALYPPEMLTAVFVAVNARKGLETEVKAELAKNALLAHVTVKSVTAIDPDEFRFTCG